MTVIHGLAKHARIKRKKNRRVGSGKIILYGQAIIGGMPRRKIINHQAKQPIRKKQINAAAVQAHAGVLQGNAAI